MSKSKAVNFIHSYKGYLLVLGAILIIVGFVLSYLAPREGAKIETDWLKGEFPAMSIVGFGLIVVPYLGVYLIQTVASKFGKKDAPPAP